MGEQSTGIREAYRERLIPGPTVWLVVGGLVAMVAIAYGAALGSGVGWIGGALGILGLGLLMWRGSPLLIVTDQALIAGSAVLPLSTIGEVRIVDRDAIAALRGPQGDARLYVVLRPSSTPDGLLVIVEDPDDPHPAWLLSSRHPQRMAEVLTATMESSDRP